MTRRVAEMGNGNAAGRGNCAVFDIGKSFAKLSVVTPGGEILVDRRTATPTLRTPLYDAFDTDVLFDWLLTQLKALSDHRIDRIMPVAHGAACALLDENEALVMPIQDYETSIPPAVAGLMIWHVRCFPRPCRRACPRE
jgi:L-fuculokinase